MKNILIVDDNPTVRAALRMALDDTAHLEVFEAADGVQAIRAAQENKPDLVLMDLSMPNLNGAEAAVAIRSSMPKTRIIVFSLYPDLMGRIMAKACGIDLVLSKADGVARLVEEVRSLLAEPPN